MASDDVSHELWLGDLPASLANAVGVEAMLAAVCPSADVAIPSVKKVVKKGFRKRVEKKKRIWIVHAIRYVQ